jgi:hypothetical protein
VSLGVVEVEFMQRLLGGADVVMEPDEGSRRRQGSPAEEQAKQDR